MEDRLVVLTHLLALSAIVYRNCLRTPSMSVGRHVLCRDSMSDGRKSKCRTKKKHNMNQCVTTAFHTHVFDVLSKRGDDRFVLSVAVTTASSLVAVATAIFSWRWQPLCFIGRGDNRAP